MTLQTNFEIWAQIILCDRDKERIRKFFVDEIGINQKTVIRRMHLSIYYARRPMLGVIPLVRKIHIVLPTAETRFMVMAPGGENPSPDIDPKNHKVGIRIQRKSTVMSTIIELRNGLLKYETESVLGGRSPSNLKRNAFGSRYYQPHIAILRTGSEIDTDLTIIGNLFRYRIEDLTFDKFIIDVVPAKKVAKTK